MASVLADLLVKMDVESAKVRTELTKLGHEFNSFGEQVGRIGASVKHILELQMVEVVAHATEKLFEFVKSGAEAAEKMGRLAESCGVAVEEFSAMAFAAKMVDMDAGGLANGMEKLARNMAKAGLGSGDAARAFKAIGIEATNADGSLKGTQEVFLEVADKFAKMENGAGKTALAMMIFGRSGADLIPLLNKGSERITEFEDKAKSLGKVFTTDLRDGSERFMESLKLMQGGAQILGATIATELAPSLDALVERMTASANSQKLMKEAAEDIAVFFKLIATAGLGLYAVFAAIGKAIGEVAALASAVVRREWAEVKSIITESDKDFDQFGAGIKETFEAIWANKKPEHKKEEDEDRSPAPIIPGTDKINEQEKALERVIKMAQEYKEKVATFGMDEIGKLTYQINTGTLAEVFETAGPAAEKYKTQILEAARAHQALVDKLELTKKGEQGMESLARYAENLDKELNKLSDDTAVGQARWSMASGELKKHIDAMQAAGMDASALREQILKVAEALDRKREADRLAAEQQRLHDEAIAEAKNILSRHAGAIDKYVAQLEKVNRAYREGGLTADEYQRAMEHSRKDFEKAGGVMNDFAKQASQNVEDIFAENLFDHFSKGLDGMVMDFARAMEKMVAQAIAKDVMGAIFPKSGGASTNWLNQIGDKITGSKTPDASAPLDVGGVGATALGPQVPNSPLMPTDTAGPYAWQPPQFGPIAPAGGAQLGPLAPSGGDAQQGPLEPETIDTTALTASSAQLESINSPTAQLESLNASSAVLEDLQAASATIPEVTAESMTVATIDAGTITGGMGGEGMDLGGFGDGEEMDTFAGGGDIWRSNGPSLVGEKGPELFTPNVSGHITSTQDLKAALSGSGSGTGKMQLEVHPDALHMTLKDWLEGELSRQAANR